MNSVKDEALNRVVCPVVMGFGIHTMPVASLLVGEAALSSFLHYGIILPSPIGVELMEFLAKMIFILERKKIAIWKLSAIRLRFCA